MRNLTLNAVEIDRNGIETGKTFSVTIPYQKDMELFVKNTIYSPGEAINHACRLFYGEGRNLSKVSAAFCGKISEPARYMIESVFSDEPNISQDSEWSAKASPIQKMQKLMQATLDPDSISDSYLNQIPSDLLDVVNFFRRRDENTFCEVYYNHLLNKDQKGLIYIDNGDIIYDIGVGGGDQLIDLSNAVGSTGKIFGIDIYPEKLIDSENKVKTNSLENVHIAFGDGRDLSNTPLRYNAADKVLIFGVFGYLDKVNVDKMLDEAVKACKSDGKIILNTAAQEYFVQSLEFDNADRQLVSMVEKGVAPLGKGIVGTLFSKETIEGEFEKRGLSTTIHSYSNKDIIPINIMDEPDYIRNLPFEHFVVAQSN